MTTIATQSAIIGTAVAFLALSAVGFGFEYAFERFAPRSYWFTYSKIGIRYNQSEHRLQMTSHLGIKRAVKFTFNDSLHCKVGDEETFATFSVAPQQTRWNVSMPSDTIVTQWVYRAKLPRRASVCYVVAQPSIKTNAWGFDKYQTILTAKVKIEPFTLPPG